ncbi:ethanolamine ammonia-lyase reactivating factor EutA [Candidatus Saccharibacteria bacterium]|nr:ethanolamine ammonia-lyase reactivating factor EutA [Candidatus Saccharibacteria bacterium]
MLEKFKNFKVPKKKVPKYKQERYVVGLDIGTEYVKALIAKITNNTAEIIGVGRAHQELGDMQAGAIADIAAVVANCDKALSQAEQQAGLSARAVVIGIAGELVKGTTTTVRYRRNDPNRELTLEEISRIVGKVQERAEEKAKKNLAWEMGGKKVDIKLVNSALVSIEIDGYKITNPVGFQGRDVVVELYTAFAPLVHIGALERTAQELDLDLLAVAAEPFAVARSVIGDNTGSSMSAILMDVGGGTTDIAVINDGGVQGTKMFGIGGRAYTRAIERDLGIEFDKAEDLKTSKEKQDQQDEINQALKKTLSVWSHGVELALSEFDQLDHLPARVLLCGGGSSLKIIPDRLKNTKWYKELPFTKQPTIQHIQPSQVVGIEDKTGVVNDHTYITALGLVRVGIDTLGQGNDSEGSIRSKIDRMLKV